MKKEKNQTDKEKEAWFTRNEDMFFSVEISFGGRENKSVFAVDFNQARQLNNFQFSKVVISLG